MAQLTIPLPDLAATARLAARLAPLLQPGDFVALHGELGAGKTAFSRCLIEALGVEEEVPSPTFTLVQTYPVGGKAFDTVWHFDLYRLESPDEVWELGLEDAFESGVSLIEWPDRMGEDLPADRLSLHFSFADEGRSVRIEGFGAWRTRSTELEN